MVDLLHQKFFRTMNFTSEIFYMLLHDSCVVFSGYILYGSQSVMQKCMLIRDAQKDSVLARIDGSPNVEWIESMECCFSMSNSQIFVSYYASLKTTLKCVATTIDQKTISTACGLVPRFSHETRIILLAKSPYAWF